MIIPSVTQCINPWVDFSKIPPDRLDYASQRGIEVHRSCLAYAKGLLPILNSDYQGYLDSFLRWHGSHFTLIMGEERLVDEDLGYSGTPDLFGMFGGHQTALIELKTPVTAQKSWRLQLAAYSKLIQKKFRDIYPDAPELIGSLQLNPDGKVPKMIWYEKGMEDFNLFLSALNLYRFFNS